LIADGVKLIGGGLLKPIADVLEGPAKDFFSASKSFYETVQSEGLLKGLEDAGVFDFIEDKAIDLVNDIVPGSDALIGPALDIATRLTDELISGVTSIDFSSIPSEIVDELSGIDFSSIIDEISSIDITSQDVIDALFDTQGPRQGAVSPNPPSQVPASELTGGGSSSSSAGGVVSQRVEQSDTGSGLVPGFLTNEAGGFDPFGLREPGEPQLNSGMDNLRRTLDDIGIPTTDRPPNEVVPGQGNTTRNRTDEGQNQDQNNTAIGDEVSSKLDEVVRELKNLDLNVSLNEQDLARGVNSAEATFGNRRDRDNN
jgi:hypothetical protein